MKKSGFTLIELLVASLLMGMLVTILTMVFNQSAISWRTGKAGVAELGLVRYRLALMQRVGDSALPFVSDQEGDLRLCRVVGPWSKPAESKAANVRNRGIMLFKSADAAGLLGVSALENSNPNLAWLEFSGLQGVGADSAENFIVGVTSWGPDGVENTADDITSWPLEEN